ncbi:MAG: alpha-L-glutamate ligase-like protein [Halioglobus sp.]
MGSWVRPSRLRALGMLGMNRRNVEFINRYNPRHLYPLVDDKLKTKLLAQEFDVPTPRLQHVIREQHQIGMIEDKLSGSDGFVIKPAKGSGGKGILVITDQQQGCFTRSSGSSIGITDIHRHATNVLAGLYSLGGAADVAIVEDLIEFDDCFEGYSFEGVPDIRIIVFRGYPVMAMLRLATSASDGKANLHQGAVGLGLSLDTGRCLNAVQDGRKITHHPDTGQSLSDIVIPNWRDILMLAANCYEMTGLGYIGTDIVLDKSLGPQLLELNARPGLAIQIANGCGLLPRLRQIESRDRRKRPAPEQRVDYAMREFVSAADSVSVN